MAHELLMGVYVKIDRAKKHLSDLKAEINAFHKKKPYRIEKDTKSRPGYELHRFYFVEPIPIRWGGIVGDLIHNLRAALDNLAIALVAHNGTTDQKIRSNTFFPIASSEDEFADRLALGLKGASEKTHQIVQRLRPYKGGREKFWQLHQLDILDKHYVLIPVWARCTNVGIRFPIPAFDDMNEADLAKLPKFPFFNLRPKSFIPLANGDIVSGYGFGKDKEGKFRPDFRVTFDIAFGEGQIIEGQPVFQSLQAYILFTEKVVKIFNEFIFDKTPAS